MKIEQCQRIIFIKSSHKGIDDKAYLLGLRGGIYL